VNRPLPAAERSDNTGDRGIIPPWLWLLLSCLIGVATAVALLHLAGAARQLPY
jgi:hypothetical protein